MYLFLNFGWIEEWKGTNYIKFQKKIKFPFFFLVRYLSPSCFISAFIFLLYSPKVFIIFRTWNYFWLSSFLEHEITFVYRLHPMTTSHYLSSSLVILCPIASMPIFSFLDSSSLKDEGLVTRQRWLIKGLEEKGRGWLREKKQEFSWMLRVEV